MQSEDLQRLLKSLQDSQSQELPPPIPAPTPPAPAPLSNDIDELLRGLRSVSGPPSLQPPPVASTSRRPSPPLPAFETFQHTQEDPLEDADLDDDEDYQMYEAMSKPDLRFCSYPESLSILGDLCQTVGYINQLKSLKKAQEEWEIRQLHQRNRILMGIRKETHTARDLRTHDLETLAMYDELKSKQQQKLEELGTPVFSVTQDKDALKRQKRIMQTLEMTLDDLETSSKGK